MSAARAPRGSSAATAGSLRVTISPNVELPYGRQVVDDVLNRTETAMTQAHAFLATELALRAQAQAQRLPASRTPS